MSNAVMTNQDMGDQDDYSFFDGTYEPSDYISDDDLDDGDDE